jgi:preprotein translocase subunit SecA
VLDEDGEVADDPDSADSGTVDDATEEVAEPAAAPQIKAKGLSGRRPQALSYSAPAEDGSVKTAGKPASTADDPYAGVGRNAPCPCGSGKKYKMCHGRAGGAV